MQLQKIEEGKPYPFPFPQKNCMTAVVAGSSLTLLAVLMDMSDQEEQILRQSGFTYGLYTHRAIPFILCDFKGCAQFGAYINIFETPKAEWLAFLAAGESGANMVQLYAIDGDTGIWRGRRTIGTAKGFIPHIRAVCIEQLTRYASADDVAAVAQELQQRSIMLLIQRAKMILVPGEE
jgi:hypothetical protein